MKQLLLLFIAATAFSCGSMYNTELVEIQPMEKVIEVDGAKNDLYVKANNWMVEQFVNAKSVVQFTDKESGTVTGKYNYKSIYATNGYGQQVSSNDLFAILKIQVKDNTAKITIMPESFNTVSGDWVPKSARYTREEAVQDLTSTLNSFESYMKTTKSDW